LIQNLFFPESGSKFSLVHLQLNQKKTSFTSGSMKLISRKKPFFEISPSLRSYLTHYSREQDLHVSYEDLGHTMETIPLVDKDGKDTLWVTCLYDNHHSDTIFRGLIEVYSQLKAAGDIPMTDHLYIERVDYCTFGNSNPYRIRIVNMFNDNHDHFYIKKADASRVVGLELEDILSPNRINYLTHKNTLVEEHIAGIPGDVFLRDQLQRPERNHVRLAKEFVKFNERCFVRLLGDMRSYNYVIDVTPDFEEEQYRVRAIDFDQQSYEGKTAVYYPHFFPDNQTVMDLCTELLNPQTIRQYQMEERALMSRRLKFAGQQIDHLMDAIYYSTLSTPEKTIELSAGLAKYHKNQEFLSCSSMGSLLLRHINQMLNQG
jgi:hypothetical protein